MTDTELRIATYICEEVRRQGHDLSMEGDGVKRVEGMWTAWKYAMSRSTEVPSLVDILVLGSAIESCNAKGYRRQAIYVGREEGLHYSRIRPALDSLVAQWHDLDDLQFYRQFEEIHPFLDGNGRTGKVLLNWHGGTLDHPIFPPQDFWGHPIRNP